MRKKSSLFDLTCIALGMTCVALCLNVFTGLSQKIAASSPTNGERVIVIDAGHGDFDPGAVAADGTQEKGINLSIALQLRDLFLLNGYTVVMTREDDTTLDDPADGLSAKTSDTRNRSALADSFGDAVFISIHQNAFADTSQHGTQVFFGTRNERSEPLAKAIMASVVAHVQPDNRRETKRGTDSIYILTHTNAPTVLVECGFMTNEQELALLKDETYQKQLAWAVFLGYLDYERGEK